MIPDTDSKDERIGTRAGIPSITPDRFSSGEAVEIPGDGGATILVVDDEPLARQLLSDLLEAQGFEVITVAEGEEAFAHLEDVDLVLLDGMLPDRDGWEVCQVIKRRYDPLLPIIMVTARTAPDDVVRTFDAGADDYVAKPFHTAELMARIGTRLRVHRAERALQKMNRKLADLARQNYDLYEQARSDAEERARLLSEIDHRVRNNLAIIMGLVSLERNRRPSRSMPEAQASLENRLRSFLLVHEALRDKGYLGVPVREIVERMAQRLRNNLAPDGRIQLEIIGEIEPLDEDQGFSLSLAMNELLTNAFRHAFPGDREGKVEIRIEEEAETVQLIVCDDGIGLACAQDRTVLGSGRSIVDALVRGDLDGHVEYVSKGEGTCVILCFTRAAPNASGHLPETSTSARAAGAIVECARPAVPVR